LQGDIGNELMRCMCNNGAKKFTAWRVDVDTLFIVHLALTNVDSLIGAEEANA
jgi:hypothetical protein